MIGLNQEIDPAPYAPIECPLCNAHGRVRLIATTSAKGTEFFVRCIHCNREWSAADGANPFRADMAHSDAPRTRRSPHTRRCRVLT
jgi:hypothetical protein